MGIQIGDAKNRISECFSVPKTSPSCPPWKTGLESPIKKISIFGHTMFDYIGSGMYNYTTNIVIIVTFLLRAEINSIWEIFRGGQ